MGKKTVRHSFHFILLAAIPVLFIVSFFRPIGEIDVQLHDTYFVFGRYVLAALFSLGLGLKALMYYLTRTYQYSKALCYVDVFLSILICLLFFYLHHDPAQSVESFDSYKSYQSKELYLILGIVFWVLIQLFVFINFFVHLLMRTDGSVGGK